MENQNNLNDEEIESKIYNNNYPLSKYSKGQKVIAQKNRLSNPDDLTFCPGTIEEIYDNNTYLILFENNESKILTKKYFYTENFNSTDEMKNYELYLNQSYGVGAKVEANINENNDQLPEIQSGIITQSNYETKTFQVTFSNGIKVNDIPIEHIYNNCNYYIAPPVNIKEPEEQAVEEEVIEETSSCQELSFDSLGFLISNKLWIGIIIMFLSLFTGLLCLKKIYDLDCQKLSILKGVCNFVNNPDFIKILRVCAGIINLLLLFFIIILFNKNLISIGAITLYITLGILILFLFQINRSSNNSVIDLTKDGIDFILKSEWDNDFKAWMQFFVKLGWSFLISFSLGPIYLILYFLFLIPNIILPIINKDYSQYCVDFTEYIFGMKPKFMSILLYFAVLSISFGLYVVLMSHCFNGIVDLPNRYSQYNNLTLSLKFRITQILTGIQTYIKNNLYTIIYISVVIVYILLKKYNPISILRGFVKRFLPEFSLKVFIYLVVIYFILKLFIWKILPSLKKLDFEELLKKLNLDGFVNGLKDATTDITSQQYSQKNLPPNQIYDLGNIK